MHPNQSANQARLQTAARRLVINGGPDAGRLVNRLSLRGSGGGAERLAWLVDSGLVDATRSSELTSRDGDRTRLLFMVGVSCAAGPDTIGGRHG